MIPTPDRPYLAAFLDVRGQAGLVVGGGEIAARRAATLLRSGMRLTVVAPELCETLAQWTRAGTIAHRARRFEPADLEGAAIVVAATGDSRVNAAVAAAAKVLRIAVNVVDDPSLCTFIVPAVVDRIPMQIAVSTGAASPVVARRVAGLIERAVPEGFARLAALAARYRAAARHRWPEPADRARFWERVLDGEIADLALAGRVAEAEALLASELERGFALPPKE